MQAPGDSNGTLRWSPHLLPAAAQVVSLLGPSELSLYQAPVAPAMAASFEYVSVDVQRHGEGCCCQSMMEQLQ